MSPLGKDIYRATVEGRGLDCSTVLFKGRRRRLPTPTAITSPAGCTVFRRFVDHDALPVERQE